MRSEVLKYEDDFADMQLENGTLREQLEEQHLIIAKMKTFADNPEPRIHFGEAREQYSYDVFRFAAKILNCKLTCKTAHRVTEVFMEEFFPGKVIRIPPPTQWELWRQDMLLAGRYKALKLCVFVINITLLATQLQEERAWPVVRHKYFRQGLSASKTAR